MTKLLLPLLLTTLFLTPAANAQPTPSQIKSFMTTYEQALQTQDFAQVKPLIHPQAVFRFTEGDFVGHEAIEAAFQKTWALDVQNVEYFLTNVNVINLDTHSATITFNWNWKGDSKEGPFHIVGRGTSQVVLSEGQPQLILEHLGR